MLQFAVKQKSFEGGVEVAFSNWVELDYLNYLVFPHVSSLLAQRR